MNESDRYEAGLRARRRVLGDAHVDRALAHRTPFTADFQDLLTRYAWGEIWTRPSLDDRTRRLIVLALMAALGRDEELKMHVRAAVEHGMTADDVKEALLLTAVYCGVPAANGAFRAAEEALGGPGPQSSGKPT